MLYYAIILILGVIIGFVIGVVRIKTIIAGVLRFYEQDPGEPPVMTAELHETIEGIRKRNYVIFEVSHK